MAGPPVALLHGFATSCERTWREPGWFDLLADAGREVIGVELLGHGNAEKPHDPAAYDRLEEHASAQLPADRQVDAIGFSLGARVLLVLAAERPERFGRIVVAGVGANLFRQDDHEALARAIRGDVADGDVVAHHFAQLGSTAGNDPEALAACMSRPRAPLTAGMLATITQ